MWKLKLFFLVQKATEWLNFSCITARKSAPKKYLTFQTLCIWPIQSRSFCHNHLIFFLLSNGDKSVLFLMPQHFVLHKNVFFYWKRENTFATSLSLIEAQKSFRNWDSDLLCIHDSTHSHCKCRGGHLGVIPIKESCVGNDCFLCQGLHTGPGN